MFLNQQIKQILHFFYDITVALTGSQQGPVVQSIVSITSSLRGQLVKCYLTIKQNTQIFFVEKNERSFPHFFNKNIGIYDILKFEILTKR